MQKAAVFSVLTATLLLVGCATTQESPQQEEVVEVVETAGDTVAETVGEVKEELPRLPHPNAYPVENFEGDALYDLLVAEVAVFRGDLEMALEKYMKVAVNSRDPGVASRATSLAAYLRQNDRALAAAQIWAEEEPDNLNAHRSAADLLMRRGDLETAMSHIENIKRLGGMANFGQFAYQAASLNQKSREVLLEGINRLLQDYPDDEQLVFSKAVLLEQNGALEEALVIADALLAKETNINVVILKLNALRNLDRIPDAVTFLNEMITVLPDNGRLRTIYARFLFETKDLDGSKAQYKWVLQRSPKDGEVLFALALIEMEQRNDIEATQYLNEMIKWNRRAGEAHFYLGSIAERNNDPASAIREYRQVGQGYEFLPAHSRIASILLDQGRLKEARAHFERIRAEVPNRRQELVMAEAQLLSERQLESEVFSLLDEHVSAEPGNIQLLYFRAMTGERFDRLDILERDLRTVIDLDPDNADAMNALGYTLTDRTERHHEAFELIEKALSIKPDEAAFIDSMGWVLYRLRNFEEAVVHLRKALALFPNDEVAAHLGEVLWVMGEQLEASRIWDEALQLRPDSEILNRVIQQFRSP